MTESVVRSVWGRYRAEGVRSLARSVRRSIFSHREPKISPVEVALDVLLESANCTVVQIGAFVGDSVNDPLFGRLPQGLKRGNARLVAVEPVKEYFDELELSYADCPNVACENVAISNHSGVADFYRLGVNPADFGQPDWLRQLGSLKKERMEALWDNYEGDPELQNFYLRNRVVESVDCLTFSDLMKRHRISSIDLLQIDVEGHELEILSTINFSNTAIKFVNYESVLLQNNKWKAERLMKRSGYKCIEYDQDTFCWKSHDSYIEKLWI